MNRSNGRNIGRDDWHITPPQDLTMNLCVVNWNTLSDLLHHLVDFFAIFGIQIPQHVVPHHVVLRIGVGEFRWRVILELATLGVQNRFSVDELLRELRKMHLRVSIQQFRIIGTISSLVRVFTLKVFDIYEIRCRTKIHKIVWFGIDDISELNS